MASFVLPILTGLSGLFGGGTQQRQATQQTSSGSQTTSGSTSGSSTPNLSPLQQQLAQLFSSQSMKLAGTDPNLSGFTQAGLEGINQGAAGSQAATKNMLAARGLAYSPAYATAATIGDQDRQHQITQFLSQIPLLQRQLQQQGIAGEEQAFSTVPVGTSTMGSTNQTQNSTGTTTGNGTLSGNPLAGLFSGLGSSLAAPNATGTGNNLQDIINAIGFGRKPQSIYPGGGEY